MKTETSKRRLDGVNLYGLVSVAIVFFLGLTGKSPPAWLDQLGTSIDVHGWVLLLIVAIILAVIGTFRYRHGWVYLFGPAIFPAIWLFAWLANRAAGADIN